jgi:hypothetical protein
VQLDIKVLDGLPSTGIRAMALDGIRLRFALAGFLAGIVVGQIVFLTNLTLMVRLNDVLLGLAVSIVLSLAVSSGVAYPVAAIPVIRQASSSQDSRTRWLFLSLRLPAVVFFGVVAAMFVAFGAPRMLGSVASLMQIPVWMRVWVLWAIASLIGALVGSRA